ncbi:predicted protein [Chaetomium globosum CBS 148.51]|uniref:Uncharacterized protein n=1 Tax=Chaetomium globosum (strain ATCC 6205 / CBS 148.51 / DSM 1962 / NBRC 6347 / NRRL 1970) TaxID=306901 RepID=Q2HBA8_CHAGB|nr:uncharacterized protein CHGG_02496 [Chaetomium globosum CBS 148.51]EAQ90561.1 predicted protein [Chaetomium globosum CBS 148.51]
MSPPTSQSWQNMIARSCLKTCLGDLESLTDVSSGSQNSLKVNNPRCNIMRSVSQEGVDRRSVRIVPTKKPPSAARVLRRSAIFRACVRSNAVGKPFLKARFFCSSQQHSNRPKAIHQQHMLRK